jgi:hypothetical protein
MRTPLNLLTWLTAISFALLVASIEFFVSSTFGDDKHSLFFLAVYSIGVGGLSQIGLFISPWGANFKVRYKLLVLVLMLPTVWLLLSRLSETIVIDQGRLSWGVHEEPFFDLIFIWVMLVYSIQIVRLISDIISQRRFVVK